MLICIRCNVIFGGIAAGMPCAFCLDDIVDVTVEVARIADTYDPIRYLVDQADRLSA